MTQPLCLDPRELHSLTGHRRRKLQCRALADMGIFFQIRGDGSPAVLRSHVMAKLGGVPPAREERTTPDWGAMHGAKTQ